MVNAMRELSMGGVWQTRGDTRKGLERLQGMMMLTLEGSV